MITYNSFVKAIANIFIKQGILTIRLGDIESLMKAIEVYRPVFDIYDKVVLANKEQLKHIAELSKEIDTQKQQYDIAKIEMLYKDVAGSYDKSVL